MSDCGCEIEAKNAAQRKTLGYLLIINGSMFLLEMATGVVAGSTALIADSLDMFADAAVYGVSLYAVGQSDLAKKRAASLSGTFQITLAGLVLFDVILKVLSDRPPESILMMGVGFLALIANVVCLRLIAKHRQGDVHMRASWIFSKNDVIANVSVIVAGLLVMLFQSRLPDLVIGIAIALLVLQGGIQIFKETHHAKTS